MNEERFHRFMAAIEDELLEEAQKPIKKRIGKSVRGYIALAACFCAVVGLAAWKLGPYFIGREDASDVNEAPPLYVAEERSATIDDHAPPIVPAYTNLAMSMGYLFFPPANATNIAYTVDENSYSAPFVSASFTVDGNS